MARNDSHGDRDGRWLVSLATPARSAWVQPSANPQLSTLRLPDGRGAWQTAGRRARFTLDQHVLGGALAAGWYELRVRVEVLDGTLTLPSISLHYVPRSALRDLEVILPAHDASGRITTLLLFLADVTSLDFAPGVESLRFRIREFRLRRVSRRRALWLMLVQRAPAARIARALTWIGNVRRRGARRATDLLYAAYRTAAWPPAVDAYAAWVSKYDTLDPYALRAFAQQADAAYERGPLLSVLLAPGAAAESSLRACLDALVAQAWRKWEAWIVTSAPHLTAVVERYAAADSRVRRLDCGGGGGVAASLDAGLAAARGRFSVALGVDQLLRPNALLRVAEKILVTPSLQIAYADDDHIDADGQPHDPNFKPDWDPDLLRSCNYVGSPIVARTDLAREVGGFRAGIDGADVYDLLLRCSEHVAPEDIVHLPLILAHHSDTAGAGMRASCSEAIGVAELRSAGDHLDRLGTAATVETLDPVHRLRRVRWPLPAAVPKASVIVPTRDRVELLKRCVESVLVKTTYPDFELVVVDNGSSEPACLHYLDQLARRERVRVLRYSAPFNYSAINNWAVQQCSGQLLGLVNNDIEVISPDWLDEMAGLALRADTGAVGAMLYYGDDTIQHAGMLLGLHGVAGHVYAGKPRGCTGYQQRARVVQGLSAVTGACLVVRRDVFESVGGLDEKLPVEFNDVDFCLRLQRRGYRNVWTPFAQLYHHESASRAVADAGAARTRGDGMALMMHRWETGLRNDPAYNPNLSLHDLECGLAFPPRAPGTVWPL